MTLRNTAVSGNTAEVSGQSTLAQGGGIFDAPIPNGPPGGPLTLLNSNVTGNTLSGSAGGPLQRRRPLHPERTIDEDRRRNSPKHARSVLWLLSLTPIHRTIEPVPFRRRVDSSTR